MKKKIKISLILSLAIIFGCFSNVFAASNQNNKAKKITDIKKSIRLFNSAAANNSSTGNEEKDQYTKLLMHMDDDQFKDECGHKVTNNNVKLDTVNKKFGNGSASFNGADSCFLTTIDPIATDFTIEGRFLFSSLSIPHLFQIGKDNTNRLACVVYNNKLALYNGSTQKFFATGSSDIQTNVFCHIVLERKGSTFYIYLNGKLECSSNENIDLGTFTTLSIGTQNFNNNKEDHFNGNLDELRLSNGIARWVPIDNINLNKSTDILILNDDTKGTDTLTATVTPDNVTSKAVKWKSSDPNIVYVDEVTGKITATGKGTATITATPTDGSNSIAKCIVTVMDPVTPIPTPTSNPTDSSDKSVLNITMTNGQVKQYNVTMDTVNKFISWYRLRSAGSGDPFYEFDITQTSSPNIIKTDYVIFNKISSFEVDDYTK